MKSYPVYGLKQYFDNIINNKKSNKKLLGSEFENFVVINKPNLNPLPIEGDTSVETLLERYHSKLVALGETSKKNFEGTKLLGLSTGNLSSITVEPGGQIELSDSPYESLADINKSSLKHCKILDEISKPNAGLLSIGVNPLFNLDQLTLFDKERYKIMYPHMKKVGTLGQNMMKTTSSLQINLDYFDHADLKRKFIYLNRLCPFIQGIFSNSPFLNRAISGYQSTRSYIWEHTDKSRSGIPTQFYSKNFELDHYIQAAIKASPYALVKNDQVVNTAMSSFESLLQTDESLDLKDFESHLGMLFFEIRIKNVIEVRCFDCLNPLESICPAAIIKALVYNESAFEKIENLLMHIKDEHFENIMHASRKDALKSEVDGVDFYKTALIIMETAIEALGSIEEQILLPFFDTYTKNKRTPADKELERFEKCGENFDKWALSNMAEISDLLATVNV